MLAMLMLPGLIWDALLLWLGMELNIASCLRVSKQAWLELSDVKLYGHLCVATSMLFGRFLMLPVLKCRVWERLLPCILDL